MTWLSARRAQAVKGNGTSDPGMIGCTLPEIQRLLTSLIQSRVPEPRADLVPVPPITPPENDGVQATLVLTGGTWKVSKQTVTEGRCAPGS